MNRFVREILNIFNDGYSVNILAIGRSRSGKSLFSFYLLHILSKHIKNVEWDMGLNINLLKNENSVVLMDEIGSDLYMGGKEEYKNRDKLYKILLTTQIKHYILVMTSNFMNDIEIIRRFLSYVILVKRKNNKLYLTIYKIIQNNLLGKVYVIEEYKYKLNFNKVLNIYNKYYKKQYETKKEEYVESMFVKVNKNKNIKLL